LFFNWIISTESVTTIGWKIFDFCAQTVILKLRLMEARKIAEEGIEKKKRKKKLSTYLQMPQRPTRLERHKLIYHRNGKKGPLLSREQLSPEELALISSDFFAEVRRNPGSDPYAIYSQVISDWGVMCHHPESCRVNVSEARRWFYCKSCGCEAFGVPRWPGRTIILSEEG
jgi:hypothetical protein